MLTNHSATSFGKRLMKRWLVGPLKSKKKIDERLSAVEHLVKNAKLRYDLEKYFRKLPDLERLCTKIYTYSVKSHVAAIYIDLKMVARLNEFYEIL